MVLLSHRVLLESAEVKYAANRANRSGSLVSSASDYDDLETIRNGLRASAAFPVLALGGRPELRRRQVKPMHLRVRRYRTRSALGRNRRHRLELSRRGFSHNGNRPVSSVCAEGV